MKMKKEMTEDHDDNIFMSPRVGLNFLLAASCRRLLCKWC
jgi:hypothetical protein